LLCSRGGSWRPRFWMPPACAMPRTTSVHLPFDGAGGVMHPARSSSAAYRTRGCYLLNRSAVKWNKSLLRNRGQEQRDRADDQRVQRRRYHGTMILTWEEAFRSGSATCGGKGYNLARLHRY